MNHQHLWPITAAVNAAGHLVIGGYDTVTLAHTYGTPLYLLDEATFRENCRAYQGALARHYAGPASVHYASKALLNTAVAQLAASEGLGLDVVSGGELYVALRAGVPARRIHLHGNAKPQAELEQALRAGVGRIVVDTLDELVLLATLTADAPQPQPIMLRLAPGIAADTHAHIATGQADSKFGLPLDALDAAADVLLGAPGLRLCGLHAHLGSQIFDPALFAQGVAVLLDCAVRLRERYGILVDEISPGGGLGVPYTPDQALPDLDSYAATLGRALAEGCAQRGLPQLRLVVEPGRSIVARAGVAIYSVVARKHVEHQQAAQAEQSFAVGERRARPQEQPAAQPAVGYLHIDGGMADNIRPSLYEARYTALLANQAAAAPAERVHVAGRFCESGDVLLRDIALPRAAPGDLLALPGVGAYTLSMASNYNMVPRPPLLLVGQGRAQVIQRRETYADLVARDAGM